MKSGIHLVRGSPKPVLLDDGVLRIYSMRFCPYAHRAHLVLDAKKLPYHTIYINLNNKPEWLVEVSPLTKVPALELVTEPGNPTIIESLIIAEYLDEKYPQNPLLPKEPLQRAQDKILVERFSVVTGAFFKAVTAGGLIEDIWTGADVFERELIQRGTIYFSGDNRPGYVDYMIWPWFERIEFLKIIFPDSYNFDEQRFAQLSKWINNMKKDDAVKVFYVTPEVHAEFWRSRSSGSPNYDLLA